MYTFLIILMIIISILLILVVLIQPGKGDMVAGMGTIGGSMSSMFGSRRAMDLLTKMTIGLAVALMFLAIVTNKFFVGQSNEIVKPVTEGVAVPQNKPLPAPIQTAPAPQEQPTTPNN
ncbi:MAG: preprotein translocase subunit SecG [Ignavibacteria bacterium]|jgi:preprotein translocase subunit SecG|nr:preprotein translocase subunit SecG [Ignavibacteria bacterium]